MTAFSKCQISGPGAESFLNNLVANHIPKKTGRVNLCHALNNKGGVRSEFTIIRNPDTSFYLVSAGAMESFDHDYILKKMPGDGSVRYDYLTTSIGVLVVAGPKSRELMQRVSNANFSNDAFPWLSAKRIDVGLAGCTVARVNFVGELGWEIHHPIEMQNHVFDTLMAAGSDLGVAPFGMRATDSMRLEKSYRLVGTELSIEYSAYESGLQRFVHLNKGDFIGREGLLKWKDHGFDNQFVTLEVHDVVDADALGNNPIFLSTETVGRATGGGYGFRLEKSLALAMIRPDLATVGTELEMDILGTMHKVTVIEESPYDPENKRLRA